MHLILASTSPFRAQILNAAGLDFAIEAPRVVETEISADSPSRLALARARAKAEDVFSRNTAAMVIGADQIMALGDETFDKVNTREDARAVLRRLAGRLHILYSALAVLAPENRRFFHVTHVPMVMWPLSDEEIEAYLDTDEWLGSVGCYKIEGRGVRLFSAIGGDSSAIIGLPLPPLMGFLRQVSFWRETRQKLS